MEPFSYEVILAGSEICNLLEDNKKLMTAIERGEHTVFMGRRNMGKTSLIVGKVIPAFRELKPKALVVFVDLMGVKSIDQISRRFQIAFEKAMSLTNPKQSFLQKMMQTIQKIRPTLSIDPLTGSPEFSLGLAEGSGPIPFAKIIEQIGVYHTIHSALLVIDEFQDIAMVEEAEGLFRDSLQQLPARLPVVILGSKKHILAKIFAAPGAPLAGWGRQLEISKIDAHDFMPYINKRLKPVGASISLETTQQLLTTMHDTPEAVNIIGDFWQRKRNNAGELNLYDIHRAIDEVIQQKGPLYREYLSSFTEKEETVLGTIARMQPVATPLGVEFTSRVRMSPGGLAPLLKRLEDRAIIYRTDQGIIIADPLLGFWLKKN